MDVLSASSSSDDITDTDTYTETDADIDDASGTTDLINNMYNTADGEEKLENCSSKFGDNRVTQNDQSIIQKGHIICRPSIGSLSQGSSQRIKTHAGPLPI